METKLMTDNDFVIYKFSTAQRQWQWKKELRRLMSDDDFKVTTVVP